MSIAMDYRRGAAARKAERQARDFSNALDRIDKAATAKSEKRLHRLSVLGALLIAAGVLGMFNSAALVQYSYGLSESEVGIRVLEATESWHELMQRQNLTTVVEQIREAVSNARQSSWEDLTMGLAAIVGADKDAEPRSAELADEASPPGAHAGVSRN